MQLFTTGFILNTNQAKKTDAWEAYVAYHHLTMLLILELTVKDKFNNNYGKEGSYYMLLVITMKY